MLLKSHAFCHKPVICTSQSSRFRMLEQRGAELRQRYAIDDRVSTSSYAKAPSLQSARIGQSRTMPQDIPMSGYSFSPAVIGDWRMSPRREATKTRFCWNCSICPLSPACRRSLGRRTGRAVVSLGIFEIVPEDRYPSREDRDRNQPKLDANGFDDMKLHITETEEASRNQGEAEDYGYRFTCPRPLRHMSPYFPVWGYPTAIESGPDHGRGPITRKPSLRKALDLERLPGSGSRKSPKRGFVNNVREIGWWA